MPIDRPPPLQHVPLDARLAFKGKLFDVIQWDQTLFNGQTATFEILRRPDTVVIYPVMNDGRIMLTRQEQPGKAAFIGAPGGRVDRGEDPEVAARRELREETGLDAADLSLWRAQQITSKLDWVVYTFIAHGAVPAGDQDLDAGEKISLMPVTFDELLALAATDQLAEAEMVPVFLHAYYDIEHKKNLRKLFYPT
jgi:8-oxo-dGTP pyrophosphatase MutT (NUDIX family)